MTIVNLFQQHLSTVSDIDDTINDLATVISAKPGEDGTDQYYNVDDNEIRGFLDNDNFYITGINDYELPGYVQFEY